MGKAHQRVFSALISWHNLRCWRNSWQFRHFILGYCLSYWLMLLFPHILIQCGKTPPLFQFDVRLTLLSVSFHPKHLELMEAAACMPGHYPVKVAMHWCTHTFLSDVFSYIDVGRQYFGHWSWYLHLELNCQFAAWFGDVKLSDHRPSASVGKPFSS